MSLLGFVAPEAYVRRRAVESLGARDLAEPAIVYGLRRLLASDQDVAVRALAAGALGSVRIPSVPDALPDPVRWLVDALADISPVVRDAAIRALARHSASAAYAPLCRLARTDTTWWVRRAALYAIGVIGASASAIVDPVVPARAALTDPFWRVRHAAVQVLAVSGNREPERRAEILADVEGGSADYLRALWGPALLEDPARDRIPSRLPPELLDRDPAVVTARLAVMPSPPPLGIVELLCDPHVPLRTLAALRLIEAGDADAFAAALNWLDEPRIPHVAATVIAMLDALGDPARTLAERVLSAPARPGASRWAIGWVVATRDPDLAASAWSRAVALDERALALPVSPDDELRVILAAPVDESLAIAAADELLMRPGHVRHMVLASIAPHASSAVRMRLAAAAPVDVSRPHLAPAGATLVERDPHAHLDAALDDRDPLTRATALSIVGRDVSAETRAAALADADPAIREAVVAHTTIDELVSLLDVDRDPWIRRRASRRVVEALHRAIRAHVSANTNPRAHVGAAASSSAHVGADDTYATIDASTVVLRLSADPDEWIRTLAIPLLDPARAEHLAQIVALAADPSPMVQSAIVEKLATISDEHLLAATTDESAQRAIDAWVASADIERADIQRAAGIERADTPSGGNRGPSPVSAPASTSGYRTSIVRRAFGSSGVEVAPLAISGAFDLQPGSLRAAADRGVDLFFWEPAYGGMSRFLRARRERTRSRVVTGTYHADKRSIVKDVERALRSLRREALDVFLLFWARSDARLDAEAFEVMAALKKAGKVRAIGFSTHDRGLAMRALEISPWDVVMTRHSAAHPGIEAAMLACAQARGAGVLTFSALCYGRMLAGDGAPSATDCYRYSLAQAGVTACISAPRRHRELMENVEVLGAPVLGEREMAAMREHGARVRVESQRFNALIRQPTRDAAAAAMAMLEAELAPGDGDREDTCVTSEALQRSLGSRGRGRASLPSAMLRRGRL